MDTCPSVRLSEGRTVVQFTTLINIQYSDIRKKELFLDHHVQNGCVLTFKTCDYLSKESC